VVFAVIVGYLLMLTNVFSYVLDALNYQGIAIVAWVAIALAHVLYLRTSRIALESVEFRPGRIPVVNPGGLFAWVLATVVGIVLKIAESTSDIWLVWGLPLVFAIAFLTYTAATRVARPSWFAMARSGDPLTEVADPWETRVRCHHCDKSYLAREMDRDPSAEHQAICAACATGAKFYGAARHESRQASDQAPPDREETLLHG